MEDTLPNLLLAADVRDNTLQNMMFMHDGAPAHFSLLVRNYLNNHYGNRWVGRGGPVTWPPRSPDLNAMDFFAWGHLKSLVYATPVDNLLVLRNRIVEAFDTIRSTPDMLLQVHHSMQRRVQACITLNGGHFEATSVSHFV